MSSDQNERFEQFTAHFRDVLREEMLNGNTVHLEGFGSFKVEHITQKEEKKANGRVVLTPPKNVVVFSAEKEAS